MSRVWISDITHACVRHDSRMTWLTRDTIHLKCVSWLVDMSHLMNWLCFSFCYMPVDQTSEQKKEKYETFIHVHVFDTSDEQVWHAPGICEIRMMKDKWHKVFKWIVSHVRIRCFFFFLAGKLITQASKRKREIKRLSLCTNNHMTCRHQSLICVTRFARKLWCILSVTLRSCWRKINSESTCCFLLMRCNRPPNASHMFLHSSGGFDCLEKSRVRSIIFLNEGRIWLLGLDPFLLQQNCNFFGFLLRFDLLYQSRAIGAERACNLLLNKDKTSAFSSRFLSSTQSFHVPWTKRVWHVGVAT